MVRDRSKLMIVIIVAIVAIFSLILISKGSQTSSEINDERSNIIGEAFSAMRFIRSNLIIPNQKIISSPPITSKKITSLTTICKEGKTFRLGQVKDNDGKWVHWTNSNGKTGTKRCRTLLWEGALCKIKSNQCGEGLTCQDSEGDNRCVDETKKLYTTAEIIELAIKGLKTEGSFISNCYKFFGDNCANELIISPIIAIDLRFDQEMLYNEIIEQEGKDKDESLISSLTTFFTIVNEIYNEFPEDDQEVMLESIKFGNNIKVNYENQYKVKKSPEEFLNDLNIISSIIFIKEEKEEEDNRPDVSGGSGGVSGGSTPVGSSGSTFLDCIKQSGSTSPEPGVGISPIGTTPSGNQGTGNDPMLNSGLGTGIGEGEHELICGFAGNFEGSNDGGLTTGEEGEADTENEEVSYEQIIEDIDNFGTGMEEKGSQTEFSEGIEKFLEVNTGFSNVFDINIDQGVQFGVMKHSTPMKDYQLANPEIFSSGSTAYFFVIKGQFYNPEPDSSNEVEGEFEIDCGNGNILLCMFSKGGKNGEGDCYQAELNPEGLPDPNTITPCDGDDIPTDAIDFPSNYLVDPSPYLQEIQQQMVGLQHVYTPILYQTGYFNNDYKQN